MINYHPSLLPFLCSNHVTDLRAVKTQNGLLFQLVSDFPHVMEYHPFVPFMRPSFIGLKILSVSRMQNCIFNKQRC